VPAVHEDYSPHTVGDKLVPFAPVFQTIDPDTGRLVPFPLGGLTISMRMVEEETRAGHDCMGTWTIDSEISGQAHYDWEDEDVNTPGVYEMQCALTDINDVVEHTDVFRIEMREPI
jgi:hypothetical protein